MTWLEMEGTCCEHNCEMNCRERRGSVVGGVVEMRGWWEVYDADVVWTKARRDRGKSRLVVWSVLSISSITCTTLHARWDGRTNEVKLRTYGLNYPEGIDLGIASPAIAICCHESLLEFSLDSPPLPPNGMSHSCAPQEARNSSGGTFFVSEVIALVLRDVSLQYEGRVACLPFRGADSLDHFMIISPTYQPIFSSHPRLLHRAGAPPLPLSL